MSGFGAASVVFNALPECLSRIGWSLEAKFGARQSVNVAVISGEVAKSS